MLCSIVNFTTQCGEIFRIFFNVQFSSPKNLCKNRVNFFKILEFRRFFIFWDKKNRLHAKNSIWIIHGGTRRITVCSSGVNNNFSCTGTHCNFSSAVMNYPNAPFCLLIHATFFWLWEFTSFFDFTCTVWVWGYQPPLNIFFRHSQLRKTGYEGRGVWKFL